MNLILGTVQMGLNYGVNNSAGKISLNESIIILKEAFDNGINSLDTAEVYGNAHEVIGEFHRQHRNKKYNIITKVPKNINANNINSAINKYIIDLEVENIDVLMFHDFQTYENNSEGLLELYKLKEKGVIGSLGVSVYTNEQIKQVITDKKVSVIQLPYNLLDNYSQRAEILEEAKKNGKIIHTRSSFLQGLFFMKENSEHSAYITLKPYINALQDIARIANLSMYELALAYSLNNEFSDAVIIGVDSVNQLQANLQSYNIKLDSLIKDKINSIKVNNISALNPSTWY